MKLNEFMKILELGSYWIKIIFHIVQMAKAENITHLYFEVHYSRLNSTFIGHILVNKNQTKWKYSTQENMYLERWRIINKFRFKVWYFSFQGKTDKTFQLVRSIFSFHIQPKERSKIWIKIPSQDGALTMSLPLWTSEVDQMLIRCWSDIRLSDFTK